MIVKYTATAAICMLSIPLLQDVKVCIVKKDELEGAYVYECVGDLYCVWTSICYCVFVNSCKRAV